MVADPSARQFVRRLQDHQSDVELAKIQRYFKTGRGDYGAGDTFLGVRMGQVFQLAKEFIEMPPAELNRLLDSDIHEVRAGAMSIMDKRTRRNRTPESVRSNCSISTSGATTGSTTGTWSTSARRSWWAATSTTGRAT
jgi:hypothetical protein